MLLQVFYWSHLLFVVYWVLLILHAPNFWKWFIVPCIIFIIEKVSSVVVMESTTTLKATYKCLSSTVKVAVVQVEKAHPILGGSSRFRHCDCEE